ncbi:MAG: HDIG domain-containing protein [Spirochaetales bacterium]
MNKIYIDLKSRAVFLVIFLITFVTLLAVSFIDVFTSETIFSLSLSEYSIDQIADRTIVAEKSLEATALNPVLITEGEEIIRKGFPITAERYAKLEKMAETSAYIDFAAFWNAFFYLLLLGILCFFTLSSPLLGRRLRMKEAIFFAVSFVIVYTVTIIGKKFPDFSNAFSLPIIIPASFFVMLITIMFGERLAVLASFLLFFAVLYASSFELEAALFVLSSCICSTAIMRKINKRINITFAALLLAVLHSVFLIIIHFVFVGNFTDFPVSMLGVALNGFISGIFVLGFLAPLELVCNTASVFRLMDLSDLNNPLMRKMLLTAPGTYNHSMLVATLAENACTEIGANGLLARVGAYYHDIGKLEQPQYFVENQREGNKHDEINPRLSVSVIRSHVKKGVERCNQMRFPTEVINIIAQHHGNSVIKIFYEEAKKIDPNVSIDDYSYMGTKPTSKEAAVVMIADTIEAACRTLETPSVSRLEKFIHQLIGNKYESGQLNNAYLTFNDLDTIERSFVTIMAGYYHSRLEYPNQKDPEVSNEEEPVQAKTKKKSENADEK